MTAGSTSPRRSAAGVYLVLAEVDPASIDPTTVTVSRDPCGRWYVSFAVDVADPEQMPATGTVAGVDLGIKDFAVTSDGEKIPTRAASPGRNGTWPVTSGAKHMVKGVGEPGQGQAKVPRAHRKVRATRPTPCTARRPGWWDYDVIVIEDLAVKNMVRNRPLAKAISDCGWGAFRRMIEYKAARAGRHLIVTGRWYPSSKTCSACGHLLADLSR